MMLLKLHLRLSMSMHDATQIAPKTPKVHARCYSDYTYDSRGPSIMLVGLHLRLSRSMHDATKIAPQTLVVHV